MNEKLLDCVEINPEGKADYTVIWLHGLGADGHDFEPIVPELRLPGNKSFRFLFPHAPTRPVTVNGGMQMRAWFDIYDMDISRRPDIDGIIESSDLLKNLIEQELNLGTAPEKLILAGFSQGGAIVLHTGLRYENRIGGILALSTYCPTNATLVEQRSQANLNVPVMMAHGKYDPVIPIKLGLQTRRELTNLDYPVQWSEYPMEHQVCMEEISDISSWLSTIAQ